MSQRYRKPKLLHKPNKKKRARKTGASIKKKKIKTNKKSYRTKTKKSMMVNRKFVVRKSAMMAGPYAEYVTTAYNSKGFPTPRV